MSKSYLKKFIKHIKNVYHIEDTLKVLEDGRKNHYILRQKQYYLLEEGNIDGYKVVAIDGTKSFGSYKKSCSECCSTSTRDKKTQYFHSAAFMFLI